MKGFDIKGVVVSIYLLGLLILAFGYFFFGDSSYKISPELTLVKPEQIKP
jgi:hypothetical protein